MTDSDKRLEMLEALLVEDQMSAIGTNAGEKTHNIVMFPGTDSLIDILKKYGLVGAAPMLPLFAPQDAPEQKS